MVFTSNIFYNKLLKKDSARKKAAGKKAGKCDLELSFKPLVNRYSKV